MNLRHFIVPLMIDGEHKRAKLVMSDDDKHGTITIDGDLVCNFEVETPGAVCNYFVAEQVACSHVEQLFGVVTELVDTGFSPIT